VLAIPPVLFLADLVYGGPLGTLPRLHVRHWLFGAAVISLLLLASLRRAIPRQVAEFTILVLALFAWNLIWASIVPALGNVPFAFVWAEADALLMLVAIGLALVAASDLRSFLRLRLLVVTLALVLAAGQFTIWLYGTLVPDQMVPLRALLTTLYQSESVFVGPMPDGAFRVFWIATLWCLLAVFWLPLTIHSPRWRALGYTLLAGSLLASYSRALWIAVALGVTVALGATYRRHAPKLILAATLLMVGAALVSTVGLVRNRLASLTSDEQSVGERAEQAAPLLNEWWDRPFLGTGYGGVAETVRSQEEPFSYELVPLALLMKLGVVGISGLTVFWILLLGAAARLRDVAPGEIASFVGACVSLLVFASSNPVFLNFVGMAVFGCLVLQLAAVSAAVAEAPVGDVRLSPAGRATAASEAI
jgi:hypothetical protein